MGWKIQFEQDTEIFGVGTARAEFYDEAGYLVVAYQDRIDQSDSQSIDMFIIAAIEQCAKMIERKRANQTIVEKLTAILNEKTERV